MTDGAHKDMSWLDEKLELAMTPLEYAQLGAAVGSLRELLKVHPELEDECCARGSQRTQAPRWQG